MEFKSKTFEELSNRELYEILKLRSEVFLVEQKITCLDLDGVDYESLHCFLDDGQRVFACMRVYFHEEDKSTARIGRVATIHHNKGYGRRLFEQAIPVIKEKMGCSRLYIHAQKYAVGFYQKCGGFKVASGDFTEDGVIHVEMIADV